MYGTLHIYKSQSRKPKCSLLVRIKINSVIVCIELVINSGTNRDVDSFNLDRPMLSLIPEHLLIYV